MDIDTEATIITYHPDDPNGLKGKNRPVTPDELDAWRKKMQEITRQIASLSESQDRAAER